MLNLGTNFQSIKPHITEENITGNIPSFGAITCEKKEDKNNIFSFEFKGNSAGKSATINFDVQYDKQTKENVLQDPIHVSVH
ncbi:MAG: hypothetical protein K2W99_05280 [Chthoniobacterales bacterium]|nr:hypothetical protein [Chthoniobacterales bacterium]